MTGQAPAHVPAHVPVHVPVMLKEVLAALRPGLPASLMIDCTLGEGGHAEAFLEAWPTLRYLGIDADPRIQALARERLRRFGERVSFRIGWYDEVLESLDSLSGSAGPGGAPGPDLVLFDLGISMFHFLESGRGFGFNKDEALDMRLSPEAPRSAADIVNGEREDELARIIFEYGEERLSRRIARAIVEARRVSPIATTGRLEELVFGAVPAAYRHGRIHPATRTFQALRIATNDEIGRAWRGIARAAALLAPGGRLAVIAFHSLEDRVSKTLFRILCGKEGSEAAPEGLRPLLEGLRTGASYELPFRKPLGPSEAEIEANPASRSAKLRLLHRRAS